MRIRSVALHPGPVQPARPPGLGFSSVSAMIFPLQSFQEAWGLELSPGGGGKGWAQGGAAPWVEEPSWERSGVRPEGNRGGQGEREDGAG